MKEKLINLIAEALTTPVNHSVTFLLGVYTVLWGLWVVNPAWETFAQSPLYSGLEAFIPYEMTWGIIAVIAGILTLAGLTKRYHDFAFYGPAASAWHWGVITVFYFIGTIESTGGITALFITILSVYIYLNCKYIYYVEHDDHE